MVVRNKNNPLITPDMVKPSRDGWRVRGAFNAGAIEYHDETLLLLRVAEDCISEKGYIAAPYYRFTDDKVIPEVLEAKLDDTDLRLKDTRGIIYKGQEYVSTLSHIRLARSSDGIHFTVDEKPFIAPSDPSECFGVEDARVVKIDDTYYINYSAVSGDSYATVLAATRDFINIERKGIIFPAPNKDIVIFPEKIGGRYHALHRPHNHDFGKPSIWYAESPDLLHWGNHKCLLRPGNTRWESEKIGGGAAPVKTPEGWLEIYHGKGLENGGDLYSLSLLLLDLEDPGKILKRGETPILFPQETYETSGFVPNVVFSNGVIAQPDGKIRIYYGACDETVCMAESSINDLLGTL